MAGYIAHIFRHIESDSFSTSSNRSFYSKAQYEHLESNINTVPKPNLETTPLPEDWLRTGGIPQQRISEPTDAPLKPGELRLDSSMAEFLSTLLPGEVRNAPVGLMNLFLYPNGDSSSVHEHLHGRV